MRLNVSTRNAQSTWEFVKRTLKCPREIFICFISVAISCFQRRNSFILCLLDATGRCRRACILMQRRLISSFKFPVFKLSHSIRRDFQN